MLTAAAGMGHAWSRSRIKGTAAAMGWDPEDKKVQEIINQLE